MCDNNFMQQHFERGTVVDPAQTGKAVGYENGKPVK